MFLHIRFVWNFNIILWAWAQICASYLLREIKKIWGLFRSCCWATKWRWVEIFRLTHVLSNPTQIHYHQRETHWVDVKGVRVEQLLALHYFSKERLWRLVLLPNVHGVRQHMWLCTAQSRLVFMDTPGITKVDWQPPAKIFNSPPHSHTHTNSLIHAYFSECCLKAKKLFSFPVDVKERTAFFIWVHMFWPFYFSCMGSKPDLLLIIV